MYLPAAVCVVGWLWGMQLDVCNSRAAPLRHFDDSPKPDELNPTWMSKLPDSTRITDMSIPGSHDTMTYKGHGGAYAQCQSWSLYNQLKAGIRYVDIRCRMTNNKFAIHHGLFFQHMYFGPHVMDITMLFLQQYPTETIFMKIQQADTVENSTMSFEQILLKYLQRYPSDRVWLKRRWPETLEEVRGKIVMIERGWGETVGAPYTEMDVEDTYEITYLRNTKREWKPDYKKKYDLVEEHLDAACQGHQSKLYKTHASAVGDFRDLITKFVYGPTPEEVAQYINPRLYQYLTGRKCRLGIISMDYPGTSLVKTIIKAN